MLKPKHSAFHATPLALLLDHLQVHKLYLAGVSSDQCVMAAVIEARMRDMEVVVPRDLVATQDGKRNAAALVNFEVVHGRKTTPASRVRLPRVHATSARSR
ncbi:isochorismatase family protein [Variovorax sp. J2P1-59]|uniref:cysteine hydrolase family protein n=1 Tax=Variovorax flavidus TaxID=3053501 RepID=UPI002575CA30|nr:isochorismatase family protein [Variovorax sp. J2P1-59]MDM0078630.1 isochorismatase family protein [Variovorax sp. J2P1-59]